MQGVLSHSLCCYCAWSQEGNNLLSTLVCVATITEGDKNMDVILHNAELSISGLGDSQVIQQRTGLLSL